MIQGLFGSVRRGTSGYPFLVKTRNGKKRLVKKSLNHARIDSWGWGQSMGEYYFRVSKSDADEVRKILRSWKVNYRG